MSDYTDALIWLHQCATTVKFNAVVTDDDHYWLVSETDFRTLVEAVDAVTRIERKEKPRQLTLLEAS